MARLLSLIERLAAGEYDVGSGKQVLLQLLQALRRKFEGGQLIHTIEDGHAWVDMAGIRKRHWRIVPESRVARGAGTHEAVQEVAQANLNFLRAAAVWQVRHNDIEVGSFLRNYILGLTFSKDGLFNKINGHVSRKARQQVLRALIDEIPAKVGEANKGSQGAVALLQ